MSGPVEFECCECHRHIINIAGGLPEPPLCAACITIPGWMSDPKVVALLCPEGLPKPWRHDPLARSD